jgi:hypothetical protein
MGRRREHVEQTGPGLAQGATTMRGHVLKSETHTLARKRARDVKAQLLASGDRLG